MASITLAEAKKLGLDDLTAGVIENIVNVNPIYQVLPFHTVWGNSKAYNRENALGDAQVLGIDGTITAKSAATYTLVQTALTTIIGDAEVNGLIQSQGVGGNAGNDVVAAQIASKAKSVGRTYQNLMVNGDTNNAGEFDGLSKLVISGQTVDAAGAALSFELLDSMINKVKSKDGMVDFILMSERQQRKLRALYRALGGTAGEQVMLEGHGPVLAYAGIPVFRSDWIDAAGSPATEEVYAGCFDDGSEKVGIAGLTSERNMGVHVEAVGPSETKDNHIWRVKFYSAFAVYSNLGVAKLDNVATY